MVDNTELELAMSIADQLANEYIEEWEGLDQDGKDDPTNLAVYNLAVGTIHAVEKYRSERIGDAEMMGEVE